MNCESGTSLRVRVSDFESLETQHERNLRERRVD